MKNRNYWMQFAILILVVSSITPIVQAVDDTAMDWKKIGHALYSVGRYQEALDSFDKSLSTNPTDKEVWYWKGRLLNNLERFQESVDAYDRALAIDPDYLFAWDGKGDSLTLLHRRNEAVVAYNQALKINPEYTPDNNYRSPYFGTDSIIEAYDKSRKMASTTPPTPTPTTTSAPLSQPDPNILTQVYNWIFSKIGNHEDLQNTAVVPTPQIVYVTVFVTPTQAPIPQPTYDAEANCGRLDGYYNSNTGECRFPTPTIRTFTPSPTSQTTINGDSDVCRLFHLDVCPQITKYPDTQPQRTSTPPSPTQTPNIYHNYLQNYPTLAPAIYQQTIQTPVPTTARQFEPMTKIPYSVPTPIYVTGQPVATPLILNINCQSGYRRDFNGNCVKELSTTIATITPITAQVCGGGNHPLQISTSEKLVPDPQPQTNVGITSPVTLSMKKITVTVICIYDTNICNYRCQEQLG